MWRKQDKLPTGAVQNQFTAYLLTSIHNFKANYLKKRALLRSIEVPLEQTSTQDIFTVRTDFFSSLPWLHQMDNGRLFAALKSLSSRDRHILFSKVLDERTISEIANELGISYGAVAMSYHRAILHLRSTIGDEKSE